MSAARGPRHARYPEEQRELEECAICLPIHIQVISPNGTPKTKLIRNWFAKRPRRQANPHRHQRDGPTRPNAHSLGPDDEAGEARSHNVTIDVEWICCVSVGLLTFNG
jgi:hypothetical protein